MKKEMTCIVCPRGCTLTVELEGDSIKSIDGFACPRGRKYATDELTHPVRTVTSTVLCDDGGVVAVKTDKPIPKDLIFECMELLSKTVAALPVQIGDVIIENVLGTDANVVASANKK